MDSPEFEFIPQPIPVYMMGESHCVVFTDRIFHEKRYLDETFITHVMYLTSLFSQTTFEAYLQMICQAMAAEHLLVGNPRGGGAWVPFHTFNAPMLIPNVHSKKPRGVPIIVVFAGDVILRSHFMRQLGNSDFDLPFETPYIDDIPMAPAAQHIPFQLVLQLAKQLLEPLIASLNYFYNMGFTSLFLHSVPPPTPSDEEFEKINGFFSPARLRYKGAILFNSIFRDLASSSGIRFLDIWDDVTERNVLKPEFHIDGTHLNTKAAWITLEKLFSSVVRDPRPAVAERYEFARQDALSWFPQRNNGASAAPGSFAETGIASTSIDREAAVKLYHDLDFKLDTANRHVRLDWTGNGLDPWPGDISTAQPSSSFLAGLYDLLYAPAISEVVHPCMNGDYAVLSVRPLRFRPDDRGPEDLHTDAYPPGALRGVLYLTDLDGSTGPLEYVDANGQAGALSGPAGTLVVLDANRVQHRWQPVAQRERAVLELTLVPCHRRLERCVIWAGMNSWPVDPFNFSMKGFVDYPSGGSHFRFVEDGAPWWLEI